MFEDIFEEFASGRTAVGDESFEDAFARASVVIDQNDLNLEFITLSSRYAYFSEKYVEAVREVQKAKMDLEHIQAAKLLLYREHAKVCTPKPTVDEVNAKVQIDPEVMRAELHLLDKDIVKQKTRHILDAMMIKRDMLQSLGAKVRAEMALDPVTRTGGF